METIDQSAVNIEVRKAELRAALLERSAAAEENWNLKTAFDASNVRLAAAEERLQEARFYFEMKLKGSPEPR